MKETFLKIVERLELQKSSWLTNLIQNFPFHQLENLLIFFEEAFDQKKAYEQGLNIKKSIYSIFS